MDFYQTIRLKPLSMRILLYIYENPGNKAEEAAIELGLSNSQVNAAISKSLQKFGLAERRAVLSPLKKKMYNVVVPTTRGRAYIEYLKEKGLLDEVREYQSL